MFRFRPLRIALPRCHRVREHQIYEFSVCGSPSHRDTAIGGRVHRGCGLVRPLRVPATAHAARANKGIQALLQAAHEIAPLRLPNRPWFLLSKACALAAESSHQPRIQPRREKSPREPCPALTDSASTAGARETESISCTSIVRLARIHPNRDRDRPSASTDLPNEFAGTHRPEDKLIFEIRSPSRLLCSR